MRLLAIRGRNLASLAEPFEIDLTAPPLAGAGLFAITGPTGAGKSTILDALCLALFNRLPRLPESNATKLGRDGDPDELRIRINDVRGILRRGAGSGWAEVEFEGRDGHRYKARWEVWRARNRPGGPLQQVKQTLIRLDDHQALGGTLTETRDEIERRLGLSFDQFRRAVLLAQGDFAAFLKAPAGDRSALLEKITGTDIYSRLSRAAYGRAQAERQALGQLEDRRAGLAVLDDGGRAALDAEWAAARQASLEGERALAAAGRARDWHSRLATLEGELATARTGLAAAEAARAAADEDRRELEALRRVQHLGPELEGCERAGREAVEASAKAGAAEVALRSAQTAHDAAAGRLAAADRRREDAEAAWNALEPELERARLLDGELERLARDVAEAAEVREKAAGEAGRAEAALTSLEGELAALGERIERGGAALATRTVLAPVAAEWPRWQATLERAAAACTTLVDSRARLSGLTGQVRPVDFPAEDYDRSLADAERQVVDQHLVFGELSGQPLMASDGLRAARTAAEARLEAVRTLGRLADAAARSVLDRSVALTEAADRRALVVAENAGAAEAETRLALARGGLAEAEAALHRLHLARSGEVSSLRAGLAAGEPCPVCGAAEHPWAGRAGAAFDEALAGQRRRVEALGAEVRGLSETLGGRRSAAAAAQRDADLAERRGAAATTELARLEAEWRAAGGEGGSADPVAAPLLERQRAELQGEIAEIARAEQAAERHRRRLAEAEAALAAARAARELARVLAELDLPFAGLAGWRVGWAGDAEGFRRRLSADVAAYLADQRALTEAGRSLEALGPERGGLAARAEAAAAKLTAAAERAGEVAGRRQRCQDQRAGVLAGRPAAAVRDEAAATRREAGQDHARAGEAHRESALALARALQSRDSGREEAARRREAADTARAGFEAALAAAGQAEETVRRLLAHDRGWLAAVTARLAALDLAQNTAATTLAERQRLVTLHRAAAEAPATGVAGAEAALAAAEAALKAARERVYDLGVRVRQDDEARTGQAGLARQIERQRAACELWGGLDEVIGSANGDKFRKFAQGLSLDQLLGHANAQLADLARRYRLERAAGSDLEIQVADCDMGDEVRSVHSLSGGETFLISLALALGLSSMAGGGAGIATLFIDEGFGALDPDSLDVALSCLEALQAGGRSVGVVSHVPAMIERIGVQVRVIAEGGGRSRVETVRRL